ncbi:MFS transporter [Streptomyces cyaneofuscatus]
MAGSVISPVVEVMRGEFGVSGTKAGRVVTAHALAVAVSSPLVGRLIDRLGVRIPLAGGLVLYGLVGAARLFTTSFGALIVSRLVFEIGAAAVFTGTTVALLQLFQGPGVTARWGGGRPRTAWAGSSLRRRPVLLGLIYAQARSRLGYTALLRLAAVCWAGSFTILGTLDQPLLLLAGPALLGSLISRTSSTTGFLGTAGAALVIVVMLLLLGVNLLRRGEARHRRQELR